MKNVQICHQRVVAGDPTGWLRSPLGQAAIVGVLAFTAVASLAMSSLIESPMLVWLPLGITAAIVLKAGRLFTIHGGLVTAASTPWILARMSDHPTPLSSTALAIACIGFGAATTAGLLGFHAVMAERGRRLAWGQVGLRETVRMIVFALPVVLLPLAGAWAIFDGAVGAPMLEIDLAHQVAGFALGLLAGLPITLTLLPDRRGRLTYHCHADRLLKVAPGMLLLLATVVASWFAPSGTDGEAGIRHVEVWTRLGFVLALAASFFWLAAHSGWFASSASMFLVVFSNTNAFGGDALLLLPLLAFVLLVTGSMEQRFQDAARTHDRHAELNALLDATGAAVVELDAEGRIRYQNPTAMRTLGRAIMGVAFDRDFSESFCDRSRRRIRAATRVALSGNRRECEVSIRNGKGPRSMHLAVFTPLHDASNRVRGCSVVLLDLATTHRREEIRRRRQDRDFESLATALVHDVNNFAMAVGGAASMAPIEDSKKLGRFLDGIQNSCLETAQRTQRIRHVVPTRAAGRLVDLGQVVSERLRRLQVQGKIVIAAMECDAGTVVDLPESFAEFMIDEFVDNAIDAAPTKTPEIALTCVAKSEETVLLRIGDNGPGIPSGIRNRVGNSFISTKGNGRGLGLRAITTGVRAAGGRLRIESNTHGTVLQVNLPRVSTETRPGAVVVSSNRDGTTLRPLAPMADSAMSKGDQSARSA